ncbi:MAG: family N-acetyltransferase [Chitinophagaceae bacterium]|nr:family N-acetyltransferase [Chitinophagaceae bacterium]
MITITTATAKEYPIIQAIARQTWPEAFGKILSPEQIEYMLTMMYSLSALTEQVQNKHHVFLLVKWEEEPVGYASYELNYQSSSKTKIHKLYLLPAAQGKRIGQLLIQEIGTRAKPDYALVLNVNRYNSAIRFYEKVGFKKTGEETIDIGNGYLMEDYIFEKQLTDANH